MRNSHYRWHLPHGIATMPDSKESHLLDVATDDPSRIVWRQRVAAHHRPPQTGRMRAGSQP